MVTSHHHIMDYFPITSVTSVMHFLFLSFSYLRFFVVALWNFIIRNINETHLNVLISGLIKDLEKKEKCKCEGKKKKKAMLPII